MKPFFVTHPWEILRDELLERWISSKDFSEIIWKSQTEFSDILNWKRNITVKWALLISTALDTTPDFWLWLQRDYDLFVEGNKMNKTQLDKVKERYKTFTLSLERA